ncbi:Exonuclease 1 [Camellia lanceoleosa]|uniref:Exonuclease 1 n=1 Tax=Camellia lanceoleosa TaxID=1840588 RepID=A0ACC0GLF7_9ERIC|nr:Exonuclease 1 [Camellia lanceoleosa]
MGYVVAPYEADAQMTFLAVRKKADAVVTEDSDLITFGCSRIIYKMDKFGQGVEFRYYMLQQNRELNFIGFTKQILLEICILSRCDYLQSLLGMGLKKAHALEKKFKCHDKIISANVMYCFLVFAGPRNLNAIDRGKRKVFEDDDEVELIEGGEEEKEEEEEFDEVTMVLFLNVTSFEKQGVNNGAGLVVDRTYHLKDFKLEAIGFASLEAKRRFRAPRSTPKHPSPTNETSRLVEHVTKEAAACKTNCSPASLLDSKYLAIASSPDDYVDNGVVTESLESLESPSYGLHAKKDTLGAKRSSQGPLLQQSRHLTHKPCMALHKEFEWKSTSDVDEGKTRIQNTKVIVRSSHFQQKLAKENDEENQNENLLGKEDVSTDKCENVNPDCENKSASVASEVKTRIKNRKIMVRSSYFPHKSVNESDQDNRQEKLLVKANLTTSTCEKAIPESASSDDSCFNSSILKRKVTPVDSNQMVVLSL